MKYAMPLLLAVNLGFAIYAHNITAACGWFTASLWCLLFYTKRS